MPGANLRRRANTSRIKARNVRRRGLRAEGILYPHSSYISVNNTVRESLTLRMWVQRYAPLLCDRAVNV